MYELVVEVEVVLYEVAHIIEKWIDTNIEMCVSQWTISETIDHLRNPKVSACISDQKVESAGQA